MRSALLKTQPKSSEANRNLQAPHLNNSFLSTAKAHQQCIDPQPPRGGCPDSCRIDHRSVCGNRFYVEEGRVSTVAKAYVYICPFCNGETSSNTRTGRIDHRSVCGNRFYVEEGRVSTVAKAYVYICPFCNGETSSNTKTGQSKKWQKWQAKQKTKSCMRWGIQPTKFLPKQKQLSLPLSTGPPK